ncbi:hypothetical protein QUF88_11810 [Bacillus sp. DX1.1]|uniref:hypothetical protein n=1 Tax=unclassified Bacillus (in: firmicutes) TaxID=185979 RepID=UPI00256FCD93|nr:MULTISPECIES: hypothetical protein [unclassified Bacillus (in: firmicutes)]MDM5154495.1 hypothetical protein [Bacillus sp. DX1.1]WJE83394.1 hypothetical protein QRE67_09310 [Bacillus sp. DX3.1]
MLEDGDVYEEDGTVLIMEPLDERGFRKFILTIPKSVYEKEEVTLEYGAAIGGGYTNIIDEIIGVYMKAEQVTIVGYVRN